MNSALGIVVAALQLAFALTWVIYVIYLPNLAVQSGLPRGAVPWILLMDQVIFVACDWLAGVAADRAGRATGRIGIPMAGVTLASAGAFLALPWVAPAGSPALFVAVTALWSATSSALRAPPLVLLGRHATAAQRPWLASLYLLGLGIASALAPYFGVALRNVDPRLPFAIATVMVVVVTLALASAERRLPPIAPAPASAAAAGRNASGVIAFAAAVALFALGFQVHFSLNSSPAYLRFAQPADLERLMPVFWIGFNVAVLPATLLARRYAGLPLMAAAGALGAAAAAAVPQAASLEVLVALQLAMGAAWSVVLAAALTAALEAGSPGREGAATGMLFSMLALAAFARIGLVAAEAPKAPGAAAWLASLPPVAWAAAVLLLVALLARLRAGAR